MGLKASYPGLKVHTFKGLKMSHSTNKKICVPSELRSVGRITKTSPCNEHPNTPHFYNVKPGFTGVYIFLIFAQKHRLWVLVRTASLKNIDRGYSLEPPH